MAEGLILEINQFKRLPSKEQMAVLYQNQVTTMELISGYKLHSKIQYAWLVILTGALGLGKFVGLV